MSAFLFGLGTGLSADLAAEKAADASMAEKKLTISAATKKAKNAQANTLLNAGAKIGFDSTESETFNNFVKAGQLNQARTMMSKHVKKQNDLKQHLDSAEDLTERNKNNFSINVKLNNGSMKRINVPKPVNAYLSQRGKIPNDGITKLSQATEGFNTSLSSLARVYNNNKNEIDAKDKEGFKQYIKNALSSQYGFLKRFINDGNSNAAKANATRLLKDVSIQFKNDSDIIDHMNILVNETFGQGYSTDQTDSIASIKRINNNNGTETITRNLSKQERAKIDPNNIQQRFSVGQLKPYLKNLGYKISSTVDVNSDKFSAPFNSILQYAHPNKQTDAYYLDSEDGKFGAKSLLEASLNFSRNAASNPREQSKKFIDIFYNLRPDLKDELNISNQTTALSLAKDFLLARIKREEIIESEGYQRAVSIAPTKESKLKEKTIFSKDHKAKLASVKGTLETVENIKGIYTDAGINTFITAIDKEKFSATEHAKYLDFFLNKNLIQSKTEIVVDADGNEYSVKSIEGSDLKQTLRRLLNDSEFVDNTENKAIIDSIRLFVEREGTAEVSPAASGLQFFLSNFKTNVKGITNVLSGMLKQKVQQFSGLTEDILNQNMSSVNFNAGSPYSLETQKEINNFKGQSYGSMLENEKEKYKNHLLAAQNVADTANNAQALRELHFSRAALSFYKITLAYQYAAAVQGGTSGSRTVSDTDFAKNYAAIFVSAGPEFFGVVQAIGNSMKSTMDYLNVEQNIIGTGYHSDVMPSLEGLAQAQTLHLNRSNVSPSRRIVLSKDLTNVKVDTENNQSGSKSFALEPLQKNVSKRDELINIFRLYADPSKPTQQKIGNTEYPLYIENIATSTQEIRGIEDALQKGRNEVGDYLKNKYFKEIDLDKTFTLEEFKNMINGDLLEHTQWLTDNIFSNTDYQNFLSNGMRFKTNNKMNDIRKYNNVFDIATNIKQGKEPSITEILDIENNMQTFDTLEQKNQQYLLHADMIEQARNMFLNLGIKQLLDEDNDYIKD